MTTLYAAVRDNVEALHAAVAAGSGRDANAGGRPRCGAGGGGEAGFGESCGRAFEAECIIPLIDCRPLRHELSGK